MSLLVREIFPTIQGEGPNTGVPAVFVRLGGCPLHCVFCDTDFDVVKSSSIPEWEILSRVRELCITHSISLVVITGGEPLVQDLSALLNLFWEHGFKVQVETSGAIDQKLPHWVQVVVSPKTPAIKYSGHVNAWKYIIKAGDVCKDGLPYFRTQPGHTQGLVPLSRPHAPQNTVYVQPCDEQDAKKNAANLAAALDSVSRFGYRLSVQVHKIVGLP